MFDNIFKDSYHNVGDILQPPLATISYWWQSFLTTTFYQKHLWWSATISDYSITTFSYHLLVATCHQLPPTGVTHILWPITSFDQCLWQLVTCSTFDTISRLLIITFSHHLPNYPFYLFLIKFLNNSTKYVLSFIKSTRKLLNVFYEK